MNALIAVLPGDGIGPEVLEQAVRVLEKIGRLGGHGFELHMAAIGGEAIDSVGEPLPAATREVCKSADAVLLGAVGGPRWSDPSNDLRPEDGLLRLRKELDVFANLRPVKPHPALRATSPVRTELLAEVDLVFVRELTGGLYFGAKSRDADTATDQCIYTRDEIVRIVRVACELAVSRSGKVTSIDKANVLETSRLWRATADQVVTAEFPTIVLEHLLVDAAAMHLMTRPGEFDVIVTENMFGDILSDEASVLTGSLGMLPSASLGTGSRGLYEPVHGSGPDIVGKGVANPYGAILSVALLLRHSLALEAEALAVEAAVDAAIDAGALTPDLAEPTQTFATTDEVGAVVLDHIGRQDAGRRFAGAG